MANPRPPYRVVLPAPIRLPILPNRPAIHPPVNNRRPPALPKRIPVLQAPAFLGTYDFAAEETEGQLKQRLTTQSTIPKENRHRTTTRQIIARPPTSILQQNYPRQPLPPITTRPVRRAEPKYTKPLFNAR